MAETVLLGMPTRKLTRQPQREGKTFFIRTFGCQMNDHDSERIGGLLVTDGMAPVDEPETADVVIVNTCTIRENADERLRGYLGSLKQFKDANPGMQIAVGGCMAQRDGDTIMERAGWVDVVFGTHNTHRVLDLLDQARDWGPVTEIWESTGSVDDMASALPMQRQLGHSAWVTITVGCNNSCTFCIVPLVRGPEISRRPVDIISEVRRLVADGVTEVTLLGQNVNSYGRDLDLNGHKPLFADVLRQVGSVEGIRRIRYMSPHPKDIRKDVMYAMAETPAVCEQLHLPLQSGSATILSAMHRGYTSQRFLAKLEEARSIIDDLSVSTDIIVGFPGETEQDFQATLDTVATARFDTAFMFQYSPRPGTPAADYENQISSDVVQERFERLIALQDRITAERYAARIGQRLGLLVEGPSKRDPSRVTARTRGHAPVHVAGGWDPGTYITADIIAAGKHHLIGEHVS